MMATVVTTGLGFGLGVALSLAASAVLVIRLERVGERFGLSEAALGLLAALGADAPEITSAVTALLRGQRDIGAGIVLGSNVFNLAALLGLSAVLAGRIALHRRVVQLEGFVALWMAAVSIATVAGLIGPAVGLTLALLVLAPYIFLSATRPARRTRIPLPEQWRRWLIRAVTEEELELSVAVRPRPGRPQDAWIALGALAVVVMASVEMEHAASTLGLRFGVPSIVVGGIVLAAVTSLPNVVAAVYLAGRGRGSATLSEAMNSNTLNVIVGLLLPAAILGLGRPSGNVLLVAIWYGGLTLCTLALALAGKGLGRRAGSLVMALYLAFVIVLMTR